MYINCYKYVIPFIFLFTSIEKRSPKYNKMRITFTPPSESEFKQLFLSSPLKKGGGLDDINIFQPRGIPHRRGSGILSMLSGVAKKVLPFLIRAAKPAAREFGSSIVRDVIKKKPLRQSLKKNGIKALKKTGVRLIRGSGKIKKRRRKINKKMKKKINNNNNSKRKKL